MKFIREHIAFRILWLVMALHILNCSVDTLDVQPNNLSENPGYNDMESIVEIILEQILDIDNAIAEYDEQDTNSYKDDIELCDEYCLSHQSSKLNYNFNFSNATAFYYKEKYSGQFHPEITPPPPKA